MQALCVPEISVIVPLFNELECVEPLLEEISSVIRGSAFKRFEVICVDDGSEDGTLQRLIELSLRHPEMRIIALGCHAGKSAALLAGARAARAPTSLMMDGDLQDDPRDGVRMAMRIHEGNGSGRVDCVVGWRINRRDSLLRRMSSRLANALARHLVQDDTHDRACGLKACRTDVLCSIPPFEGMHRFIAALVRQGGGRVEEIEVNNRARARGKSKYGRGLGRTFVAFSDALVVRWMARRRFPKGEVREFERRLLDVA